MTGCGKLRAFFQFCEKKMCAFKRVNSVPIFGVSKNKDLLVIPGQDSVRKRGVSSRTSSGFLEPELYVMCSTSCQLLHLFSTNSSRCKEPALNGKNTSTSGVSPTALVQKRSVALLSPAGITPSAKRSKDGSLTMENTLHSAGGQTTGKTSRRTLSFSHEASEENGEDPLTVWEKMQASINIPQEETNTGI